jgi:hypothetical protein
MRCIMNEPIGWVKSVLKQGFSAQTMEATKDTAKGLLAASKEIMSDAFLKSSNINRNIQFGAGMAAGAAYSYSSGDRHLGRDMGLGVLGVAGIRGYGAARKNASAVWKSAKAVGSGIRNDSAEIKNSVMAATADIRSQVRGVYDNLWSDTRTPLINGVPSGSIPGAS